MQTNKYPESNRKKVEAYIPMVHFIAAIGGPRREVALHCLDDINHSIIAIENGHVTGRQVGDGLVDFALESVFDKNNQDKAFVVNIYGKPMDDNKHLRLSGYFIRNEENETIGILTVTVDETDYVWMKSIIEQELLLSQGNGMALSLDSAGNEQRAVSAAETLNLICSQAMEQLGFSSPRKMRKDDKMKVIATLYEHNLFAMKGMIKLTAQKLEISEPTVYRYVQEHRSKLSEKK